MPDPMEHERPLDRLDRVFGRLELDFDPAMPDAHRPNPPNTGELLRRFFAELARALRDVLAAAAELIRSTVAVWHAQLELAGALERDAGRQRAHVHRTAGRPRSRRRRGRR